jgi:polyisoprenoid-binding protein YceI
MLRKTLLPLAIALLAFAPLASAEVEAWRLDPVHSNVGFKVQHFMVSWVRGNFTEPQATIWVDRNDLSSLKMEVIIKTASVNTGNQRRDDHLRNPDFFDSVNYPEMKFVSKRSMKQPDGSVKVIGDLTMRGKTHEVTMDVTGLTKVVDPGSGPRMGASARAVIQRSKWGVSFVEQIPAGGVTIGDDVAIEIEAELRPVPPAPPTQ